MMTMRSGGHRRLDLCKPLVRFDLGSSSVTLTRAMDAPSNPETACLFIVTGSDIRAEAMDRPLAYALRDSVLAQLAGCPADIVVVSDFRYLHDFVALRIPTLSLGGPGVNALCQEWLDSLPVAMQVDGDFWIQMAEPESDWSRASIWGVDHAATRTALATFQARFLAAFLNRAATAVAM